VLRVPEIASLRRAHPQSWQSAQKPAESVWQSAKNTQRRIQRAKHVQKPVESVSNTVKAQRNSPMESRFLGLKEIFSLIRWRKGLFAIRRASDINSAMTEKRDNMVAMSRVEVVFKAERHHAIL